MCARVGADEIASSKRNETENVMDRYLVQTRKAWHIVGYTADAEVWCCLCTYRWYGKAEGREDHHGNPVHPIYSNDEHDGMGCNSCGEELS